MEQRMKVLLAILCLGICAKTCFAQSITSFAKTCNDCHATNAYCGKRTDYVVCSCKSGFAGNGLNCTKFVSCDKYKCCPRGYTWNSAKKVCEDINECDDPSLNMCTPKDSCVNKKGVYLCSKKRDSLCPTEVCPNDLDCLTINGNVQCADPCTNYQQLDGQTRLATINSTGRFLTDRYNIGWFRYTGSIGQIMKEGCVGALKCGSLEPFTLAGPHPLIGEGVKMVPLKNNALAGCFPGSTIPVKACPGEFYVYKFTGMLKFDVYCTDTVPQCENSTTSRTATPYPTTTFPTVDFSPTLQSCILGSDTQEKIRTSKILMKFIHVLIGMIKEIPFFNYSLIEELEEILWKLEIKHQDHEDRCR